MHNHQDRVEYSLSISKGDECDIILSIEKYTDRIEINYDLLLQQTGHPASIIYMLKDLKEAFNTITAFIHERNQVLTCLKHRLIYERIEYHDIVPMTDDSGTITFVFDEDVQLLYDIDGTFDCILNLRCASWTRKKGYYIIYSWSFHNMWIYHLHSHYINRITIMRYGIGLWHIVFI